MNRWLGSVIIIVAIISTRVPTAMAGTECAESFPEIFQRVSPSVVYISALAIDPFKIADRVSWSVSSGSIISDDGLVLTNSHGVFERQVIIVTLDDGRKTRAKLLGADPILDLAVLRIPVASEGQTTASLGDSDSVRVGEDVIAIGNPLGLDQTLTRGVVSGVNRILNESPMSMRLPLIQTDAAINPGNSGGPLLNRCGEVIGITTSMMSDAQNIGFAIPINIAKQFIPELIKEGRIIRPWFGMSGQLVTKELMEIINMPLVKGFLVETIEPGSPAEQRGIHGGTLPFTIAGMEFLLGGDIITDMNGQSLDDPKKFEALVRSLKVGDKVHLTLYREKETRKVEITLPERPILPGDLRSTASETLSPMGDKMPWLLHHWDKPN